jgi:tetratricopeptide (TPR) repeat protein
MGTMAKSGARTALIGIALCTAASIAAADDRAVCGSVPPKSDAVGACSRIIASPVTSDHDRALAYSFRADAGRAKGDMAGAIADYSQALTLLPNLIPALMGRGTAYLNSGDNAHAIADLDLAVQLVPQNAKALYERGVAKGKSGDTSGGEADIAAATKLDPNVANQP